MSKTLQLAFVAVIAAFISYAGLAPARAAGIPAGPSALIDQSTKPLAQSVRWHGRRHAGFRHGYRHRPVYRHRHAYNPVYVYRPAPIYRRCVLRPRIVWTPYGYARRMVRVCRPLPRPRPHYYY